jgi:glutaconate CoA-transferase, subunit A
VQGYYGRQHDFYHQFHDESRTVDGFQRWLAHWVDGVEDWPGFLARLPPGLLETIRVKRPLPSEPLDYGA